MRESFVMHAEYIDDLPDEYKPTFLMYTYNYGIKGEVPDLQGLERVVWIKIQRRIDADFKAYEEKTLKSKLYKARCHMKEGRASQAEVELLQKWDIPKNPNYTATNTNTNTHSVFDIDNDIVNDIDIVNVNDIVNEDDDDKGTSSPSSSSLSEPQTNYSEQIHNLWIKNNLPADKDLFKFQCMDFKPALEMLKGINSTDVIQACENYIKELKNKNSYITKKYSFSQFINSKTFNNCLPSHYRAENFIKYGKEKQTESRLREEEKAAIMANVEVI